MIKERAEQYLCTFLTSIKKKLKIADCSHKSVIQTRTVEPANNRREEALHLIVKPQNNKKSCRRDVSKV